ncbi:glycosyltransferase [Nocardia lasii]|uniref:Glycosyltransferase n=1 Tax=Nocardia lasii TaxID=1616107 RepID=A0ABW1JT10_9NOCA
MNQPLRVLICSTPIAGHVNPAIPIARELVARGHEVHWYTGARHQRAVERAGAVYEPIRDATDPLGRTPDELYPQRVGLTGLAGVKFDIKHLFLDEIPGQLSDVRRILTHYPADLVLADPGFMAAAILRELDGPPFATYGVSILTMASRDVPPIGSGKLPGSAAARLVNRLMLPLVPRLLFGDVHRHYQTVRAAVGLPRTSAPVFDLCTSPDLYLQGSTASFEFPRSDLPPQVHFVGPLLPDLAPTEQLPAWWDEIDRTKPVVLVNQGTVATDLSDLIEPAMAALADEDVTVIATGGSASSTLRQPIPPNARVEEFVPFGKLLPLVDVMVTNGGYGGVQFALANGVPLVVAGATEEKPDIAARVEWTGVGVNLRCGNPTPDQLRTAVRTVLTDPTYRTRAQAIQREAAALDSITRSVDLIEGLHPRIHAHR